jgi:hypothetical protein
VDYDIVPNGRHEELQAATLLWSVERGVVRPASPAHRSLARMRSDLATVLAYPGARGHSAQLISDFIGWYLLLDDELESSGARDDLTLAAMPSIFDRYLEALAGACGPCPAGEAPGELLRGALDLGVRLRALGSPAWQARFLRSMRTYFDQGVLPEMIHYAHGTLPSMSEYAELRVDSSGSYPIFDLIELASERELPERIAAHPLIRELRRSAALTISWANDVLSFHKEKHPDRTGALNLPRLLMTDGGLSEQQAFQVSVGIHNGEMRHYLRLQQAVREDAALDPATVQPWLRDLDVVMRGLLEWQLLAARYTELRGLKVSVQGHAPAQERNHSAPIELPHV